MLGIRHHFQLAIDLYQGIAEEFEADRHLTLQAKEVDTRKSVAEQLVQALQTHANLRHLAFDCSKFQNEEAFELAGSLMLTIREKVTKAEGPRRRLTFILARSDQYFAFQSQLFRTFPGSEG